MLKNIYVSVFTETRVRSFVKTGMSPILGLLKEMHNLIFC